VQLDGRTIQGDFYRRGFNGMEKDDEVKGGGNSYDFGARMYDGRVGRFLSLDRFADKNPCFSPYLISDNNPVVFVDSDGNFRISKKTSKNYPQLTNILKNIESTVMNDPALYSAFCSNLGLNERQAKKMLKWGKGPKIDIQSMDGAFAETSKNGKITLNKEYIEALEGRKNNIYTDLPNSLVGHVFITILHEAQHSAEFIYNIFNYDPYDPTDPECEGGFSFELTAFGSIGETKDEDLSKYPKLKNHLVPIDDLVSSKLNKEENAIFELQEEGDSMKPSNKNHLEAGSETISISERLKVDTTKIK
jgi:RHS repeat-associated protein